METPAGGVIRKPVLDATIGNVDYNLRFRTFGHPRNLVEKSDHVYNSCTPLIADPN